MLACCLLVSDGLMGAPALDWKVANGYKYRDLSFATNFSAGFTRMPPQQTSIAFVNLLTPESDARNANLINGSGLALGDVDGDGWCDIYLCSLNGTNTLYRNLGGWRFEDVTASSGLGLVNQLSRGAVFADVEGDGDLDLIVTFNGRGARLFLNDGRGHFTEKTDTGFTNTRGGTSASLGDLDGDGDLDLYVANYGEETILRGGGNYSVRYVNGRPVVTGRWARRLKIEGNMLIEVGEQDDLYINEGGGRFVLQSWANWFLDENGQPIRTNLMDYGFTVQLRDLNDDGRVDIYVANDFHTPDRFWLNQGGGVFRAVPWLAVRTMCFASMGMDFGDLDRDGLLDLFCTEMKPTTHDRLMRQLTGMKFVHPPVGAIENRILTTRNVLQWNRGDGTYAELAYAAQVAASDWTWVPAFLDVDLDGFEDILVTTGYSHNVNDMDMLDAAGTVSQERNLQEFRARLLEIPPYLSPNYAYRNLGNLRFEEVGRQWGFHAEEISHGIAMADLDNDGDLDVVVNCLNAPALVYRNNCPAPRVAVRLRGLAPNTYGINARVTVRGGAVPMQFQEMLAGGRYLGCDDTVRTFAAGSAERLTVEVVWPGGQRSVIADARPNRVYEIAQSSAVANPAPPRAAPPALMFEDVSEKLGHRHHEVAYDDFARQPLLPNRLSQSGPGVTWYDWDGDGWDDLIVGTGAGGKISIYRNDGKGGWTLLPDMGGIQNQDTTSLLGIQLAPTQRALVVGMSSWELEPGQGSKALIAVQGGASTVLPAEKGQSVGPLAAADVDGDGDLDVFMGGRVSPGRYPEPVDSQLYLNEQGVLKADARHAAVFRKLGLVTAAIFADFNQDGRPDLAVSCEWGPVRVFFNEQGTFKEVTRELGLEGWTGWWTGLAAVDLDGDGRLDLVAGNWGLNSHYQASPKFPARLYYGDFNGLGQVDLLEAYEELTPGRVVPRRPLTDNKVGLPFLAPKYPKHALYAKATVADLLGEKFKTAHELKAVTLETHRFLNRAQRWEVAPLPPMAQWAPVWSVCAADMDGDGWPDVFLSQNFFATQAGVTRLDAGRGLWLRNTGEGKLEPAEGTRTGVKVYGEQRGAAVADFDGDGRVDLAVTQNGAETRLYRNVSARPGLRVRLSAGPMNPTGVGAQVRAWRQNAAGPVWEVHAGGGWYSQDSAVLLLPADTQAVEVRWPWGETQKYDVPPDSRELLIQRGRGLEKRR